MSSLSRYYKLPSIHAHLVAYSGDEIFLLIPHYKTTKDFDWEIQLEMDGPTNHFYVARSAISSNNIDIVLQILTDAKNRIKEVRENRTTGNYTHQYIEMLDPGFEVKLKSKTGSLFIRMRSSPGWTFERELKEAQIVSMVKTLKIIKRRGPELVLKLSGISTTKSCTPA